MLNKRVEIDLDCSITHIDRSRVDRAGLGS